jgi:two-component sensor histidine kinase
MNFYKQKQAWKYLLLLITGITIISSLFFTNRLISSLSESTKTLSKSAASLKSSTNSLNSSMKSIEIYISKEERDETQKVQKWARAMNIITNEWDINKENEYSNDERQKMDSAILYIQKEKDIPMIFIDECHNTLQEKNILIPDSINSPDKQEIYILEQLRIMKIENDPILIILPKDQYGVIDTQKVYYKGSKSLEEAKEMKKNLEKMSFDNQSLSNQSEEMHNESQDTLEKLRYYPIYQLGFIGLFMFIAYFIFSASRKSEQNKVWAGMAKETAHQIATPLSSLIAWIELLKDKEGAGGMVFEMEKDIKRLETITDRFSKIGSKPTLEEKNIVELVMDTTTYLKSRLSEKIQFNILHEKSVIIIPVSTVLLNWVIENICKNAADAMKGKGEIKISITEDASKVILNITDNGEGVERSILKNIFKPGVTSKKRGWGLGLSLSKRIVEEYHKGRIFVMKSEKGVGTTFCIHLPKNLNPTAS